MIRTGEAEDTAVSEDHKGLATSVHLREEEEDPGEGHQYHQYSWIQRKG